MCTCMHAVAHTWTHAYMTISCMYVQVKHMSNLHVQVQAATISIQAHKISEIPHYVVTISWGSVACFLFYTLSCRLNVRYHRQILIQIRFVKEALGVEILTIKHSMMWNQAERISWFCHSDFLQISPGYQYDPYNDPGLCYQRTIINLATLDQFQRNHPLCESIEGYIISIMLMLVELTTGTVLYS